MSSTRAIPGRRRQHRRALEGIYAASCASAASTSWKITSSCQNSASADGRRVEGRPSPLRFRRITRRLAGEYRHRRPCSDALPTVEQPFLAACQLPAVRISAQRPCQEFWDLYDDGKANQPAAQRRLQSWHRPNKAPHMIASAQALARRRRGRSFEPKTFEAGRLRKLQRLSGRGQPSGCGCRQCCWISCVRAGQAENTIVVYTSDHGDYATEHGIMEKAPGICSDAITRVPLIWRAPGRVEAGGSRQMTLSNWWISPNTLCSLAGIEA